MAKETLGQQAAKKAFVQSVHNWLMNTLEANGKGEFKQNFTIEDSSIMCVLPHDYFTWAEIPDGMKVEMKFTVKKG